MNTIDKIKVMQAEVDGKDIEWVSIGYDSWTPFAGVWNWGSYYYRIKPEAVVMTVYEIEQILGYKIKVVL